MSLLGKLFENKNTKAGSFYLIGNLFNKAIAFLTIPIFTRLMSTADYGIVNTYLSWVSILSVIVGLSLGSSIRSAYIEFEDDLDKYISSIFFLSVINFLISSVLIVLISFLFIEELDVTLVILCLIQSFMTFVINSISIIYMMSVDYIKRTLLLAVPNIIVAILSVVFLMNLNKHKYFGRIVPYVMVTSVVGIFYLVKYFIKGKEFINKKYWKYAITLSLPLVFHGLSVNILATSDRTMITAFFSASETGIYSLVYSLSMIATVVTTSMESVWIPWFTKKMQNEERNIINRNVKLYIEIVMILMIGILMIGPEILVVMAPEEYWSGKIIIPPVLLASFFIFLYSISVDMEYYYKSTKIIATNTIIAASINLGLNFIFIPLYGAIAAAFTTVIAYAVSFGIHYKAARKLDNKLFPFKVYVRPILIMVIAVSISYILMEYGLIRWIIVVVGFGLYALISHKNHRFSVLLK
ncbi:lipopolysaccharide biosynthesis protein [Clostridium sp. DL1XJH146]